MKVNGVIEKYPCKSDIPGRCIYKRAKFNVVLDLIYMKSIIMYSGFYYPTCTRYIYINKKTNMKSVNYKLIKTPRIKSLVLT